MSRVLFYLKTGAYQSGIVFRIVLFFVVLQMHGNKREEMREREEAVAAERERWEFYLLFRNALVFPSGIVAVSTLYWRIFVFK